jgi:hypothetical protein
MIIILTNLISTLTDKDLDREKVNMTDVEQIICSRLTTIINTMLYMEQTSLQDSSTEQLIKCLQKTYKVMIALVKYVSVHNAFNYISF